MRELEEKPKKNSLRKRVRLLATVTLVSVVVAFSCLMLALILFLHQHKVAEDYIDRGDMEAEEVEGGNAPKYTQEEVDALLAEMESDSQAGGRQILLEEMRTSLEDGTSAVNLFRALYPDQVVYVDDNRYWFHDIRQDWKKNPFDEEQMVLDEEGFMTYPIDGTPKRKLGVDVSRFQGVIDWEKVKNAGVEYAIIRVGMRGYESGKLVEDEQAKANIDGCVANGIPFGVYFFSEAINEAEAIEEADTVLSMIQGYELGLPVYIDIEQVSSASNRCKDMTKEERTKVAKVFLDRISAAGYKPGIYGNLKSFLVLLDLQEIQDYTKWFACYNIPVYYPYDYDILQYSEKGTIDGIPEPVDLNIALTENYR